jgi:hypothetical protein
MDIDSCIEAYIHLSGLIFKKRGLNVFSILITGKLNSRFGAVQLERSIKQLCVSCGLDEDAPLLEGIDANEVNARRKFAFNAC